MTYVDGFVIPVPKKKLAAYKKIAKEAGRVWMKHGALSVTECVADDVKPGKLTSFPQAVMLKKTETVVFSFITYKSRSHRDKVMARVFKDPFMARYDRKTVPFDGMRMFWGGFRAIVSY